MLSEIEHYLLRIEDLRRQVSELIAELPVEALNWRPITGSEDHATNSLAVLAAHVAGAEHFWIYESIGGHAATRDRDAEFVIEVNGPDGLLARLQQVGEQTRSVLPHLTAERLQEEITVRGRSAPVRWAILHVIDHTALHLGHMQITYQLWQDGKAKPSPRWFERLPGDSDSA